MFKKSESNPPSSDRKRLLQVDESPLLHAQFSNSRSSLYVESNTRSPNLRFQKRDKLFVFGENFNRLIDEQDPLALHLEMDDVSRSKNHRAFTMAVIGIVLMVIENFINWDGDAVIRNSATESLKLCVSITTFFLVLQVLEHYHLVSYKLASGYFSTSLKNIPVIIKHQALPFLLEMGICMWHIPPYLTDSIETPDKYGIFMFFRLYMALRVLRDYSPVYRNRGRILQRGYDVKYGPGLDSWAIHVRMHFDRNPGLFMSIVLIVSYLTLTFCIYVNEREVQESFTFSLTLWYTAVTMTTIGYGDYTAITTLGRICAMTAGVLGLLVSSLCVAVMAGFLALDRREKFAVDWVSKAEFDRNVEKSAATVIQCWWRLLKLRSKGMLTPALEYKYASEVIRSIIVLRRYRKEFATLSRYVNNPVLLNCLQLEGRYDPILDRILSIEDRIHVYEEQLGDICDSVNPSTKKPGSKASGLVHRIGALEMQQRKMEDMLNTQIHLLQSIVQRVNTTS